MDMNLNAYQEHFQTIPVNTMNIIIWDENIKKHEDLYASEGDDFY